MAADLTLVEPSPAPLPDMVGPAIEAVAIRLADEGIPVRAIARATRIPSEDIYQTLRDAIGRGVIVELPKDDWPVGSVRSARSMLSGTILDNEDALRFACHRLFKSTRLQSCLLSLLLRRSETTKDQLHNVIEANRPSENSDPTDKKMVDVVICHLRRKLRPFKLEIETIWGAGYMISPTERERAVRMLIEYTTQTPIAEAA